ncbi:MAG TPA: isoprenyl transferase [Candidatus Binatia bacterium]|nr:isoprenyl transferase [Candidatus Binatia bacterium]
MSLVDLDRKRLPRHVAIIMDGNGRWASGRGLPRIEGHRRGKEAVRAVVETARRLGIPYLSLYAFSTENWNRPQKEVDALMGLLRRYLATELRKMMRNQIRLLAIGNLDRLPAAVQDALRRNMEATRNNTGMTVVLAVSYGGREELAAAMRTMAREVQNGTLDPASINERTVSAHLSTAGIPDPDLLIRTSGEMRVSNFLLWQIAYSELLVTPTLWPDFGEAEFVAALSHYQGRERRFGRTPEQIERERIGAVR